MRMESSKLHINLEMKAVITLAIIRVAYQTHVESRLPYACKVGFTLQSHPKISL